MKKEKIYKIKLSLGVIILLAMILFLPGIFTKKDSSYIAHAETLTVYKSPTCGCCENYVAYMRRAGYTVEIVEEEDMDSIKRQYNIPQDMYSCHTTVIGEDEYVVEGHIPFKAIEKLLDEKPPVKGIAMPGMPQGSPGMPGTKRGLFTIYSIDNVYDVSQFMQL